MEALPRRSLILLLSHQQGVDLAARCVVGVHILLGFVHILHDGWLLSDVVIRGKDVTTDAERIVTHSSRLETGVAQRHRSRGLVQRRVAQVEAHELASILQVGLLGCWQHALREVIDACRLDRVDLDALGRLIVVAELRRVVGALVQALELNVDSRLPDADHV